MVDDDGVAALALRDIGGVGAALRDVRHLVADRAHDAVGCRPHRDTFPDPGEVRQRDVGPLVPVMRDRSAAEVRAAGTGIQVDILEDPAVDARFAVDRQVEGDWRGIDAYRHRRDDRVWLRSRDGRACCQDCKQGGGRDWAGVHDRSPRPTSESRYSP